MPGTITLAGGVLLGRTGLKQTFMWIFDGSIPPLGAGCTETTEGTFCIALLGKDVLKITEKLTILDPGDPKHKTPFLLLGPFSHVTSHLIVLKNDPADAVVLIAGSRGFAHDMVHDILAAGEEWGLRPAGEMKFQEMLKSVAA